MKKILIVLFILSAAVYSQTDNQSFYTFKSQTTSQILQSETLNPKVLSDEIKTKKSAGLAVVYSLLLPGMGELYADAYKSGVYFTVADGFLWGAFIGMNVYGGWQKDNYISYAQFNGDVASKDYDDDYYATVGEYMNIDEYNNEKALERDYDAMYDSEKYYWKWNTNNERKSYREMWESSEHSYNNVRFVVGALLLNRVISAINAVRLVSKYNNNLEQQVGWNVYIGVQNNPDFTSSYNLNFSTSF